MWVIESSSGKFETLTQDEDVATFCRHSGKNVIELEDDGESLDQYIQKIQRLQEEALLASMRSASPSMDRMLKQLESSQLAQEVDSLEGIDEEDAEAIKNILRQLMDSGDFPEGADVTVVKLNLGSLKDDDDSTTVSPMSPMSQKYS